MWVLERVLEGLEIWSLCHGSYSYTGSIVYETRSAPATELYNFSASDLDICQTGMRFVSRYLVRCLQNAPPSVDAWHCTICPARRNSLNRRWVSFVGADNLLLAATTLYSRKHPTTRRHQRFPSLLWSKLKWPKWISNPRSSFDVPSVISRSINVS